MTFGGVFDAISVLDVNERSKQAPKKDRFDLILRQIRMTNKVTYCICVTESVPSDLIDLRKEVILRIPRNIR